MLYQLEPNYITVANMEGEWEGYLYTCVPRKRKWVSVNPTRLCKGVLESKSQGSNLMLAIADWVIVSWSQGLDRLRETLL